MELKILKNKTIQELILMALTYRVSYKNLAILLNSSEEEIKEVFESFLDMQEILRYLDFETRNEDEINQRVAYINAKNYLNKRQLIMKELILAKKENNKDAIKEAKEKLDKHFELVNDSFVLSTVNKNISELTQEECDAISRFRLKYGASKKWSTTQLKRDRRTINRLDEELAQRNPIFREKIELLNDYWHERRKEFTMEYAKKGR